MKVRLLAAIAFFLYALLLFGQSVVGPYIEVAYWSHTLSGGCTNGHTGWDTTNKFQICDAGTWKSVLTTGGGSGTAWVVGGNTVGAATGVLGALDSSKVLLESGGVEACRIEPQSSAPRLVCGISGGTTIDLSTLTGSIISTDTIAVIHAATNAVNLSIGTTGNGVAGCASTSGCADISASKTGGGTTYPTLRFFTGGADRVHIDLNGNVFPNTDNSLNFGIWHSNRWASLNADQTNLSGAINFYTPSFTSVGGIATPNTGEMDISVISGAFFKFVVNSSEVFRITTGGDGQGAGFIAGTVTAGNVLRCNGTHCLGAALVAGDIPDLSATYLSTAKHIFGQAQLNGSGQATVTTGCSSVAEFYQTLIFGSAPSEYLASGTPSGGSVTVFSSNTSSNSFFNWIAVCS